MSRRDADGAGVACPLAGDRFQCPGIGFNYVRRQLVEVDTRLREALLAQPVGARASSSSTRRCRWGASWSIATGLPTSGCARRRTGTVELRVIVDGDAGAAR